jgi:hypothetical protein
MVKDFASRVSSRIASLSILNLSSFSIDLIYMIISVVGFIGLF